MKGYIVIMCSNSTILSLCPSMAAKAGESHTHDQHHVFCRLRDGFSCSAQTRRVSSFTRDGHAQRPTIDLQARCHTQEVTDRHCNAITLSDTGWWGKLLLCMVQVLPRKTKGMLENTGSQSATKNEKRGKKNWV